MISYRLKSAEFKYIAYLTGLSHIPSFVIDKADEKGNEIESLLAKGHIISDGNYIMVSPVISAIYNMMKSSGVFVGSESCVIYKCGIRFVAVEIKSLGNIIIITPIENLDELREYISDHALKDVEIITEYGKNEEAVELERIIGEML